MRIFLSLHLAPRLAGLEGLKQGMGLTCTGFMVRKLLLSYYDMFMQMVRNMCIPTVTIDDSTPLMYRVKWNTSSTTFMEAMRIHADCMTLRSFLSVVKISFLIRNWEDWSSLQMGLNRSGGGGV